MIGIVAVVEALVALAVSSGDPAILDRIAAIDQLRRGRGRLSGEKESRNKNGDDDGRAALEISQNRNRMFTPRWYVSTGQ